MAESSNYLSSLADALRAKGETIKSLPFLIGFDGFIDEILHVVDIRESKDDYRRLDSIAALGEKISSAAGKSANFELVPQLKKVGGNGPLMSMAVSGLGARVTYVGLLGYPDVNPVFKPLQDRCAVHSIAEPGTTDALEFRDGKLMLGKLSTVGEMNWKNIMERLGEAAFSDLANKSKVLACTNWTMLPEFGSILDNLVRLLDNDKSRLVFFDLADPGKRDKSELGGLIEQMKRIEEKAMCVLGLNLSEAEQISQFLGLPATFEDVPDELQKTAGAIREKLSIHGLMIHSVKHASANIGEEGAGVVGPYCANPKITTGAGDHFNGGFATALASGFTLEECLNIGSATSGWYVRHGGESPRLEDIVGFLRDWGEGKISE